MIGGMDRGGKKNELKAEQLDRKVLTWYFKYLDSRGLLS